MIVKLLIAIVALPFALWGLLSLAAGYWRRHYFRPLSNDETHFVKTVDGWRLALHRFRASGQAEDRPHVLIVHGLAGNARNFDFSDRQNLPRFLAERGIEAWVLELRGAGMSDRPSCGGPFRFDYGFTDHLGKDLPAAIEYVKRQASGPIHYVGHSMGGMLAYGFLPTKTGEGIVSCTILASPGNLTHFDFPKRSAATAALRLLPSVAFGKIMAALAPLYEHSRALQRSVGFHPDNLYPGDAAVAAANNQDDVPVKLMVELGTFVDEDVNGTGRSPISRRLPEITTPTQFLVGAADQAAPVESVRAAFERFGSEDKRFIVAGKENGFRVDYEHVDLVLGKYSREEIHPLVAEWIKAHG